MSRLIRRFARVSGVLVEGRSDARIYLDRILGLKSLRRIWEFNILQYFIDVAPFWMCCGCGDTFSASDGRDFHFLTCSKSGKMYRSNRFFTSISYVNFFTLFLHFFFHLRLPIKAGAHYCFTSSSFIFFFFFFLLLLLLHKSPNTDASLQIKTPTSSPQINATIFTAISLVCSTQLVLSSCRVLGR